MAFKIIINGITADLKGASKQELVFQNPIFDYEAMTGSYGLPFSLPFSKTNDRIFNNARSEFSAGMPLNYLCEQYLNDDLVAEGLIVLKDTNGAYNINFTSNIRDIFTPVSGSVLYDGYLRDILPVGPSVSTVANRNAMTTWNNIVCYPSIENTEFYSANAPVGWAGYVNDYSGTTYFNTTFVPAVSVKHILTQMQNYYGITFIGDAMTEPYTLNRLVVFTNSAEDGSATANLKIAVGDIKVAEFITVLRQTFGLSGLIDINKKTISLDFCKKCYDAEVKANWSGFCSPINSRLLSPFQGIELSYDFDTQDKFLKQSDVATPYISNNSKINRIIKAKWSPIAMSNHAIMSQAGRTNTNNQFNQPVGLLFGYYNDTYNWGIGIRPYINQGWAYNMRNSQRAIIGPFNFSSEETFWKNTFEATFKINLRKLSLSGFDIKSKVHIHGWNYLIKRIVMDCNNPENSLLEAYRA